MVSVRLLATNGYEFLPRDGASYDGGQRSTRCDREIGGKCGGLRRAIALRVPVAELVGGLVGMPREARRAPKSLLVSSPLTRVRAVMFV